MAYLSLFGSLHWCNLCNLFMICFLHRFLACLYAERKRFDLGEKKWNEFQMIVEDICH